MNTLKTNFHTHTQRCRHASGCEEDYIKSALMSDLSQLGFSDHAPYPDIDLGRRMLFHELTDYLEELDALTIKYQNDITIRKGLEIEYLPQYRNYYETLLTKWELDYLLLGAHFYINPEGKRANTYEISSSTKQYLSYAQTIAEGMRTGLFKVVAHPDLYLLNSFAWNEDCKRAADLIIDTAVATNTILEYNANGFRQGLKNYPDGTRFQYPHDTFWHMASHAPIRVIVGSDCHAPEYLWDEAVELAYQNLHELGIQPIMELGI